MPDELDRRSTDRLLGEHSAQLKGLKETVEKIDANVDKLLAAENQRKGGMKVVYAISAGFGALGAALAEAFVRK